MRRSIPVAFAAAALFAASAAPAAAITWGEPDGYDHPQVVNLLFVQDGVGYYSCSGTLLSPELVLTAGHCVEGASGEPNDETWVTNHPDPLSLLEEGQSIQELFGSVYVEGEALAHPQYDSFSGFPDTYDIGVVHLSEPINLAPGEEYGELPPLNFLESLVTKRGAISDRQVAVVGYGQQGTLPPFYGDDLVRYQGVAAITGLSRSRNQGSQNVQTTNNPGKGSGSGGTCFGDSGGPAFWIDPVAGEETNMVVAVISFGITGHCAGTDFSFRTDTLVAQKFITSQM